LKPNGRRVIERGVDVPPAQPITLYSINDKPEGGRCIGTIGMPVRDSIKSATAVSWLLTDPNFMGRGEWVAKQIIQGNILTYQRNELINRMDGDWIIFIDDDMTWQPDAIRQLVETQKTTDADIVGGLCFQRGAPYQPTLYYERNGLYTFAEDWEEGEILEVDATGMAFALIHRRVFDRLMAHFANDSFPSLEERQAFRPIPFFRWEEQYGEDFLFCREAKEAGCRIVVDTSIEIGHITEVEIKKEHFWREMALRPKEQQQHKHKVNRELGLKSLTAREAKRRVGLL